MEIVDIVNEKDEVIGQKNREDLIAGVDNWRVINAFVINPKTHQIWIPRRAFFKKRFPFCLDASVGGYVKSGESYLEAAIRETQEELNFTPTFKQPIIKLTPQDHGISAFMEVFAIYTNETPKPAPGEFFSHRWLDIKDLSIILKYEKMITNDLPLVLKNIVPLL